MSDDASGLIHHPDGCPRCWWPGLDPVYVAYHDTEWGVPEHDGRALYEKLILDGFQAGLSWITILRRREGFRKAFAGFDPEAIARFTEADVARLMDDTGIIRNRAKIVGTIAGARAFLAIEERGPGFSRFLWDFVDGTPIKGTATDRTGIATQTEVSRRMSKALKTQGFTFCGPTIVYAFMQAVGLVNDHLVGCHRHAACAASGGAA
ncbi:DNA-3-methyladenine glycosylase I [Methylobacterium gossipiicola]|uniref:DNA-3-methyladenine glycosylase I n=1 Tax=Methylobacterium gossipiicola TaxID=582675 RepID=A0A1I2X4Q0_9HYPH|nr:DNA-3-methyladenine glycosylase I [Methylobacterium gossipiicola]SFH08402.1 DNA-3-methyladenine glycosylase I [Methylobacterium gossipiicola]